VHLFCFHIVLVAFGFDVLLKITFHRSISPRYFLLVSGVEQYCPSQARLIAQGECVWICFDFYFPFRCSFIDLIDGSLELQ
jgi:hypothetical protein